MNNENFENGLRPNEITLDEIRARQAQITETLLWLDEFLESNRSDYIEVCNAIGITAKDYKLSRKDIIFMQLFEKISLRIDKQRLKLLYFSKDLSLKEDYLLNDMEQQDNRQWIISILNSFHITDPTEVDICLKDIQSRELTTEDEISQYIDEYLEGIENSV